MKYINTKTKEFGVDTIDQFETYKEAREMLKEYNMLSGHYYISSRCTKEWWERQQETNKEK